MPCCDFSTVTATIDVCRWSSVIVQPPCANYNVYYTDILCAIKQLAFPVQFKVLIIAVAASAPSRIHILLSTIFTVCTK